MPAQRLTQLVVNDFRGGVNLRADALQFAENEVQFALNVEIDARGGFYSRRGWQRWHSSAYSEPAWNPRRIHAQVWSGIERMLVANKASYTGGGATKGTVLVSNSGGTGALTAITVGANNLVCAAVPHMADFAAWGDDTYIACGSTESAVKYSGGSTGTLLTAAASANWDNDFTAPTGTRFPKADVCETHLGYMFVGCTNEDGTAFPHRIRWSHPNSPTDWAVSNYIDILEGGSRITALQSFSDHLLIFKTDSTWRLDGYDKDSWQLSKVSDFIGAPNAQLVSAAENRVYVLSYPHGVFEIASDGGMTEVSEQIRPGIQGATFNGQSLDTAWISYVGQRLWCNVPYDLSSIVTEAHTSLVYDPLIKGWTAHRSADGNTVGPMWESKTKDVVYGAARSTPSIVQTNAISAPNDQMAADPVAFECYLITKWFDYDGPTHKKAWKRPDFLFKDSPVDLTFNIEVYHDFNEASAARAFNTVMAQQGSGFIWGSWTWGSGAAWGAVPAGSRPTRGSSLGNASSVRLRINGPSGLAWGVSGIVFKAIAKRFK